MQEKPKKVKRGRPKKVLPTMEIAEEIAEGVNSPVVSKVINEEKEKRRKFLLDLQEVCARERITSLSDIERKLEELERI